MSPKIENPRIDTRGTGNKSENILLAKRKEMGQWDNGCHPTTFPLNPGYRTRYQSDFEGVA